MGENEGDRRDTINEICKPPAPCNQGHLMKMGELIRSTDSRQYGTFDVSYIILVQL